MLPMIDSTKVAGITKAAGIIDSVETACIHANTKGTGVTETAGKIGSMPMTQPAEVEGKTP